MLVKITKIYRSDKNKQGNPLKTQDGRPYTRVAIQTQEHGAKWVSGFENFNTKNWKEGDSVEIEVEPKGEYLNFKTLSETGKLLKELNNLANRVASLEKFLVVGQEINGMPQADEPPPIDDKDLPF